MSFLQSRAHSAREGFGKPVLRKEDARLLVGAGCYSDDVNLPGQAYACFVRSPHAHARIGRIDTAAALAIPGVIAVLTGEDAVADRMKPLTHSPMPGNPHEEMVRPGDVAFMAPHPPIPADRVRFAGEVVAMVIAETPAAARDGAECIAVDWGPLRAVTGSISAAAPDAPLLYEDIASNVCVDAKAGDDIAVDAAFGRAAHVVRLETWVHRVTGVPMEPRAAVGVWDPASGRYTVHAGAGGLGRTQTGVAGALGVPERAVRVMARDVGGISGRATAAIPSSRWWPGRRDAWVAPSSGRVSAGRHSSPTTTAVTSRCAPSWR